MVNHFNCIMLNMALSISMIRALHCFAQMSQLCRDDAEASSATQKFKQLLEMFVSICKTNVKIPVQSSELNAGFTTYGM